MQDHTIFVCGDVMTGRGIDQILLHPNHPQIYESYLTDAREYVTLAEGKNGNIPRQVAADYIWGDALDAWRIRKPKVKIVNLETAVTQSNHYWQGKAIHYRMHPKNIDVITSADIDICTLANNHILDWGYSGLSETLSTLKAAHVQYAGAGENLAQAIAPASVDLSTNSRLLVFSLGLGSSGIPENWSAAQQHPGVYFLQDLSEQSLQELANNISRYRKPGDLVCVSIHWGGNWGYAIPQAQREFAHRLIDQLNVDWVFGHSSHHPRPIEIYRNKPILYGCGDFINDYEGITGHEEFRGDLTLMYFLTFDSQLNFTQLELAPMQIKGFRLHYAGEMDGQWILQTLARESSLFNTKFVLRDRVILVVS